MLAKDRYGRLYDLHSWIGILFGFFIYFVVFTGTVAVFYDELLAWEDPTKRLEFNNTPVLLQPKIDALIKSHESKGHLDALNVSFKTETVPYYRVSMGFKDENKKRETIFQKWHPDTLEVLPERGKGMASWILNIHRYLMLPVTLGRTLVGLSGVLMLVLIITGILAHGRIITDFFKLRLQRSERIKWRDSHKVLGIFSLPFTIMISFTGAFLGVITVLGPVVALIAFQGNTEALIEKVVGKQPVASGQSAMMISIDDIQVKTHPDTGLKPYRLNILHYQDKNAEYQILYGVKSGLKSQDTIKISGVTGKVIPPAKDIPTDTSANAITAAIAPLHYGTYGGMSLKWLYIILGVSLCVITASGTMIWVNKRIDSPKSSRSPAFYRRLLQANVGVSLGVPIATVILFYHDKLYIGAEPMRLYWTGITYFTCAIALVIMSFFYRDGYSAVKSQMILLGVLCSGVPVINCLTTSASFWPFALTTADLPAFWVDLSMLAVGLVCIIVALKLRSVHQSSKVKETVYGEEPIPD